MVNGKFPMILVSVSKINVRKSHAKHFSPESNSPRRSIGKSEHFPAVLGRLGWRAGKMGNNSPGGERVHFWFITARLACLHIKNLTTGA
jgi:hypothetical protein